MKLPKEAPHYMIFIRDIEHKVTFDFDPGESQWFDARAGVGSPGYGPELQITEIDPPIELTEAEAEAVEQEIMDRIIEDSREAEEAYAEGQYEAFCEERKWRDL